MAEQPTRPGQVDVNPENWKLVHDVASIFHLGKVDGTVFHTLQLAVCSWTGIYSTGTPGHKIVEEEPTIVTCPFVLELSDGQDIIIGSVKHRNDQSYFYGVASKDVKDLTASDEKHFHEPKFWMTLKVTDERVRYAKVLDNTASAKLYDNFMKILKLTPMFASQKLTSTSAFAKWCNERSFKDVIKAVCVQGEKLERGVAQGHAASPELGGDHKERWQAASTALLKYTRFYEEAFARRFLIMENADALDAVVKDVKGTPMETYLEPALRDHAAHGSRRLSCAPVNTPIKKLLEEPPPKPMATAPATDAATTADTADAPIDTAAEVAAAGAAFSGDDDDDDDDEEDGAAAATATATEVAPAQARRKRTPTTHLQPGPEAKKPKPAKKAAGAKAAASAARKAAGMDEEKEKKPVGRPRKTESSKHVDSLVAKVRVRG